MLFISSFSKPVYSATDNSDNVWAVLAASAGKSVIGMAQQGQAATMAAIAQQIAEADAQMKIWGITGSKCGMQCDYKCCGGKKYCEKLKVDNCKCWSVEPRSETKPCTGDVANPTTDLNNEALIAQQKCIDACNNPELTDCPSFKRCDTACKQRKALNRSQYLSWNSLLALAGIALETMSVIGGSDEDKRSCEQKCGSLTDARLKQTCMEKNTNEYGEACLYTLPAGKCDDTDEVLKPDPSTGARICDSWTGGCSLYREQCSCNVQAESTGKPYTWDTTKKACVLTKDSASNEGGYDQNDSSAITPGGAVEDKETTDDKAATPAGAGTAASLGGGAAAAGGGLAGGKGAPAAQLPKKDAKLTEKASAAFKENAYGGYTGESAGSQGSASGSAKKPTDIADSKTKEGLFEQIHVSYVTYTDAGRFLAPDAGVKKEGKAKKGRTIKAKKS